MRSAIRQRTYREIAATYGIAMCATARGCEQGESFFAHRHGRADVRAGVVHDIRADNHVRRDGLATLLESVGLILLERRNGKRPLWRAIYEANIWAYNEALHRWHVRLPVQASARARQRVLHLARFGGIPLRFRHPAIYQWATAQHGVTPGHGSKTPGAGGLDPGTPQDL